jgi:hypothetical protein
MEAIGAADFRALTGNELAAQYEGKRENDRAYKQSRERMLTHVRRDIYENVRNKLWKKER